MSLNQAQYEAIVHNQGPCLVLAGPGSGKTLTIVKRIEYLIKKYKVGPEDILVITFTKYASVEMKNRFRYLMKDEHVPVTFGTFHGIYYGILKWAYGFGPQNLLSEEEKYALLRSVCEQIDAEDLGDSADEKEFLQDIATEIGRVKNNLLEIDEFVSTVCRPGTFREIFRMYEERRKKEKKIDFDDMLALCYQLFKSRPDILKKWQEKFKYILIDEFQDINQVQYDVIKMLAAPENNMFVVGDDDQSIYAFRGARPEIMFRFKEDYPDAKELLLNVNYRSTQNIVNQSLKVIGNNETRFVKKIEAEKEKGETVHVQEVRDPVEESLYVISEIQKKTAEGIPPEKIAVLFRTNTDAGALAETLLEHNVEFQMREHIHNIYDHFVGENIKTYFQMAVGSRQRRDFLAVMNRPNRYIGRDSLESGPVSFESLRRFYCDKSWMQDRIDQFELDLRMMKKMAPYAAIQYLRKRVGYDDFLRDYALYRKVDRKEYMEVLSEIEERSKSFATLEEWISHVEDYKAALQSKARNRQGAQRGIHLMTMHGAKGLEFDTVFVICANEGSIPHKKAVLPEEIEEERRLFYVAMTRAKEKLIISYTKNKNGKDCNPSRFVDELFVGV